MVSIQIPFALRTLVLVGGEWSNLRIQDLIYYDRNGFRSANIEIFKYHIWLSVDKNAKNKWLNIGKAVILVYQNYQLYLQQLT